MPSGSETAAKIQALADITASVDARSARPEVEGKRVKSTVNPEAREFIAGKAWSRYVEAARKNAGKWVRVPIAYPDAVVGPLIAPLRMALNGTRDERGEDARHHWLVKQRPVAASDVGYAPGTTPQSAFVLKCNVWTWAQVNAAQDRGNESAARARAGLARKQRADKRSARNR